MEIKRNIGVIQIIVGLIIMALPFMMISQRLSPATMYIEDAFSLGSIIIGFIIGLQGYLNIHDYYYHHKVHHGTDKSVEDQVKEHVQRHIRIEEAKKHEQT